MTPNNGAEPPKCINSTDTHKKTCFLKTPRSPAPQLDHTESKNCLTPVLNYRPSFELVLAGSGETPRGRRCKESPPPFYCKCLLLLGIWGEGKIITFTTSEREGQKPPSLNLQERSLCPRWVGGSRAESVPVQVWTQQISHTHPSISRCHLSPYGPVRQIFVYIYLQLDCFRGGLHLQRPSPDKETETTLSSGKWSQGYSDSWSSAGSLSAARPVGMEISDFPSQSPTLLPGFCSFLSLNVPSSPRLALWHPCHQIQNRGPDTRYDCFWHWAGVGREGKLVLLKKKTQTFL